MSANSNLRFDAIPESRSIRQVIATCAKHCVAYGSPEDLRGFIRALDSDKHLAMDFWSMVARLTERGNAEAEPDRLLKIIVEGVTGHTLEDLNATGLAQQLPVQQLRSMLAGEDVSTPVAAPPAAAPVPADRKPVRSSQELRADPMPTRPVASAPPAFEPWQPRQRFPAEPAPVSPPPASASGRRLTLEPDPQAEQSNRGKAYPEPNWVIPLRTYADDNRKGFPWGKVLGGTLIAALLAGGGLLGYQYHERLGNSFHAGVTSAIDTWNNPQAAPLPAPIAQSAVASTVTPSTQLVPSGSPRGNTPSAQPPQPPAPAQAPAPETQTQQSSRPASDLTASDQPADSDSPMPTTGGGRVVVPEILMSQNLISSHSPEPTSRHASGRVVMQAIVSKHGDVEHIHVTQGDSALRQSAIDSALTRHYHPYLLNGTPVDVSTTISIDVPGER